MLFRRVKNSQIKKTSMHKSHIILLWNIATTMIFLSYGNARLALKELKTVQTTPIKSNDSEKVIVNPNGPLNLLRGYMYQECGFMYNKRLYAPEIDIKYSVKSGFKEEYEKQNNPCIFEKTNSKDEIYRTGNQEEKYNEEYHKMLIKMFPSVDNYSTYIDENTSVHSFTAFLREEIEERHAHYFLAALLLLSEGIDVSLEYKNKRVSLKRKSNEEYFFSLFDTSAAVNNIRPNTEEELTETEIMQVVRFFKNNRKEVQKETNSVEEFKQGKFLDTPRFLIQTYIFEFLETVEGAGKFNKAIYDVLIDMVPEEKIQLDNFSIEVDGPLLKKRKLEKKLPPMLSKYFISVDSISASTVYLNEVNEVDLLTTDYSRFPFSNTAYLPKEALWYETFFVIPSGKNYTPVELLLYTLFCCLVYNPETKKYSLEKMSNASEELKEFFRKYDRPLKNKRSDILKDWNKVTSDLPCDKINYLKDRNQLDVGLFNFFLAVAKITGTFETHSKKLLEFKEEFEKLYANNEESDLQAFYTKLSDYIQDMLKSLCISDKIQISCRNIYQSTKGIVELFGLIVINYTDPENVHYGKERFIKLKLYETCVNSSLEDPYDNFKMRKEDKVLLTEIKDRYRGKEGCFMHLLLIQYIDNRNATVNKYVEMFGEKGSIIKEIVENDLRDINRVFLLRKLNNHKYKRFTMGCFLTHAAEKEIQIDSESRILRFASNILGSLPLNGKSRQLHFIQVLAFVGYKERIFSNIQCLIGLADAFKIRLLSLAHIDFILYTRCKKVLIRALKEHIDYSSASDRLFSDFDSAVRAFDYLFNDKNA